VFLSFLATSFTVILPELKKLSTEFVIFIVEKIYITHPNYPGGDSRIIPVANTFIYIINGERL
jgi:hypothetical protein